jgi:hypothetical protein
VAVPTEAQQRRRLPDEWLPIVFVVILDRSFGVAAEHARTSSGWQLTICYEALEDFELHVSFLGTVSVVPTICHLRNLSKRSNY